MPFFSENHALGTNPSPWTVNGNDLYPDSTSYLVGIGTSNPNKALHIKANDGDGHIQFEGTSNSFFASVETQGATQSQVLKFSQTYWANAFFDFETNVTSAAASADLRIIADNAQRIYFRDRVGANDLAVIAADKTKERLYIYGDDGYAGGMFTMDWAQAVNTRFGFGYGDEALSTAARLAVKHVSNPQLKLDDGTNNTTFQQSGDELTIDVDAGKLKLDSGLSFASVSKTADYTMLASDHVVFCDCPAGTPGMTITLPANSAGRMVKIIDNAGSCSNVLTSEHHIRVSPASGNINGTTHVDIENAYGSVFAICDGTNWTITN